MLNAVRIGGVLVLLALVLMQGPLGPVAPAVAVLLYGLAGRALGVRARALVGSLLAIAGMAVFFSLAALASSALTDGVDGPGALRLFLSVAGALCAIRLGVLWAGGAGGLSVLRILPSVRVRIFLLLLSSTLARLLRGNAVAVYALTARLGGPRRNGAAIARYYVQNLIARELYALRWYQASVAMRLDGGHGFALPRPASVGRAVDAPLIAAIAALVAFAIVAHVRGAA